ncbi:MAG: hypothetical protein ACUVQR_02395 [Thermogutta sp.]
MEADIPISFRVGLITGVQPFILSSAVAKCNERAGRGYCDWTVREKRGLW